MDTFTWTAKGVIKETIHALNTRVEFMNGNEQVQQNAINPKRTFEATYEGSMNTMNAIRDFFEAHKSGELFYFTDSQGIQRTVRFASDDFEMQVQFGFSGNNTKPTPQGGMVTLQFREVLT